MKTHLNRHIDTRERNIECDICHNLYLTVDGLRSHRRFMHSAEGEFPCHCGKSFMKFSLLRNHITCVHKQPLKNCEHCGKNIKENFGKFNGCSHQTDAYDRELKNMVCNKCGKRFLNQTTLKRHPIRHGEKTIVCDTEGCGKKFFTKGCLQSHQDQHHLNLRYWDCSYKDCNTKFYNISGLNKHILVTHKKIKEKCPVGECKFHVGRRDYMKNHLKKHKELSHEEAEKYLAIIKKMKIG